MQKEFFENDVADIFNNNHDKLWIKLIDNERDKNNKSIVKNLKTQVANINDQNSKDNKVYHYFFTSNKRNSDSNTLDNID